MKKILFCVNALLGATIASAWYKGQIKDRRLAQSKQQIARLEPYYLILNHWLLLKQQNKSIEGYFIDKHIHTIAIYGMAELGKRLYADVANMSSVEVAYVMDQGIGEAIKTVFPEVRVMQIENELPKVDAVIVTPVFALEEIKKELSKKTTSQIVSISEVVFYTYESVLN